MDQATPWKLAKMAKMWAIKLKCHTMLDTSDTYTHNNSMESVRAIFEHVQKKKKIIIFCEHKFFERIVVVI